jgi:hypothetical protein
VIFTQTPFKPGTEGVWLDLPSDVYRNAPGVSQSMLKDFGDHASPLHFRASKPKEATEDMEFGTICHTAILEPGNLPSAYYIRPDQYPSENKKTKQTEMKKWSGNSDWCKDWLKEHNGRPVITKRDEAKIPKIVERVKSLDECGSALRFGKREVSWFKRDEITGLLCKCRTDLIADTTNGVRFIFDLKKVQSGAATHEAFSKHAHDLGYHIQAASYLRITGADRFVFVPFDDDEPFDACEFEPTAEMLDSGAYEYRRILDAYAKCVKEDRWPGYATGIQPLKLPVYAQKKLTQEQYEVWALKVAMGAS